MAKIDRGRDRHCKAVSRRGNARFHTDSNIAFAP